METGDAASIPNVTDFVASLNPSNYFASRHIFLSGLCDDPSGLSDGGVWQYVFRYMKLRETASDFARVGYSEFGVCSWLKRLVPGGSMSANVR